MGPHYHHKYLSLCSIFSQCSIFLWHGREDVQVERGFGKYTSCCERRGVCGVVGMQTHPSPPLPPQVNSQDLFSLLLCWPNNGLCGPTTSQLHLPWLTLSFFLRQLQLQLSHTDTTINEELWRQHRETVGEGCVRECGCETLSSS